MSRFFYLCWDGSALVHSGGSGSDVEFLIAGGGKGTSRCVIGGVHPISPSSRSFSFGIASSALAGLWKCPDRLFLNVNKTPHAGQLIRRC